MKLRVKLSAYARLKLYRGKLKKEYSRTEAKHIELKIDRLRHNDKFNSLI